MSTRQGIPEPAAEKQDLPDLSADLYSFLFCNYKADDLVHVDAAAMSLLAALTWAVRDLLQLAHDSRIDPKEFPLCFHDKLYRHLKQDRIIAMQQVLSKKITAVHNTLTVASSFLITPHWQAFNNGKLGQLVGPTSQVAHQDTTANWLIRSSISKQGKHLPILELNMPLAVPFLPNCSPTSLVTSSLLRILTRGWV
jgi:hypothetical protein